MLHTRCAYAFRIRVAGILESTPRCYINMKYLSYWVGKILLNLGVFVDTVSVAMSVIW